VDRQKISNIIKKSNKFWRYFIVAMDFRKHEIEILLEKPRNGKPIIAFVILYRHILLD